MPVYCVAGRCGACKSIHGSVQFTDLLGESTRTPFPANLADRWRGGIDSFVRVADQLESDSIPPICFPQILALDKPDHDCALLRSAAIQARWCCDFCGCPCECAVRATPSARPRSMADVATECRATPAWDSDLLSQPRARRLYCDGCGLESETHSNLHRARGPGGTDHTKRG
jgi:hypothetical protein